MSNEALPQTTPASDAADEVIPNPANPAVARCRDAWTREYKTQLAKGAPRVAAVFSANGAYRNAMPQLAGYENIRDFIACIAQGMLLGAIEASQSSKLLYAAQVALSTVRAQPAPPKSSAAA